MAWWVQRLSKHWDLSLDPSEHVKSMCGAYKLMTSRAEEAETGD